MQDWIRRVFENRDLTKMGHGQRVEDLNLGLGWVYYGLARAMRPKRAVVIGSYRGFVPLVLAKGIADNVEGGELIFIDPSFVDDFWKDPAAVTAHFAGYGLSNVRHFLMTTQAFVDSVAYRDLAEVGLVFIDGHHSVEQARFDFEAFEPRLADDGIALFHDTRHYRMSRMHGPERSYRHDVKDYVDSLKERPDLQVFDLPFADGVSLVRRAEGPGVGLRLG
ncbi:MAG: class I SAM-dependent methyltransferase [Bauldia sp.]|nr:class I SAM-dependent methyltransferase [Bauldia sp.]